MNTIYTYIIFRILKKNFRLDVRKPVVLHELSMSSFCLQFKPVLNY